MVKSKYETKLENIVNEYNAKEKPTHWDDIKTAYKILSTIGKEVRDTREKDNSIIKNVGAAAVGAAVGFNNGLKKRK